MNAIQVFFEKQGMDMLRYSLDHMTLTFLAILIAVSVAVPLGILLARSRSSRGPAIVLGIVGVIQTVPSLALIAFIVLFFALAGLSTIGFLPAQVALVLYALLPILRNTYTGIRQVDPAVVRVETLQRYPELEALLGKLGNRISNPTMQQLNYEADEKGRKIATRIGTKRGASRQ